MIIGESEFQTRIMLLDQLNLSMVMDQARIDPFFMAQLITRLEARGAGSRTVEESSLLEWGLATQRIQSVAQ